MDTKVAFDKYHERDWLMSEYKGIKKSHKDIHKITDLDTVRPMDTLNTKVPSSSAIKDSSESSNDSLGSYTSETVSTSDSVIIEDYELTKSLYLICIKCKNAICIRHLSTSKLSNMMSEYTNEDYQIVTTCCKTCSEYDYYHFSISPRSMENSFKALNVPSTYIMLLPIYTAINNHSDHRAYFAEDNSKILYKDIETINEYVNIQCIMFSISDTYGMNFYLQGGFI